MSKEVAVWVFGFALLSQSTILGTALAKSHDKPELRTRRDPTHSSEWLEKRVGHELRMLPYYSVFDELKYRVVGYRVEL
jgi:hypothetical protein